MNFSIDLTLGSMVSLKNGGVAKPCPFINLFGIYMVIYVIYLI